MQRFNFCCVLLVTLVASVNVKATPTTSTEVEAYDATTLETNAYNCPKYCTCNLHTNTHSKYVHAKCTQVDALLDESALEPVYPIHSIDLSNLRLSRISQIFSKLTNLTSINLSHNELHEVGHLGRRIKRLNLKNNRITSNKLAKLPENLQTLNLQHNDISYLPIDFKRLIHLNNLELSHNDINCSCETLEVRNWIQERQIFMENAVICAYPVSVKGQSWLQVKQSDICDHEKRGWALEDDENVLMAADQPYETDENEKVDELKGEFLPVTAQGTSTQVETQKEKMSDTEGSGDPAHPNMEQTKILDDDFDYDGSGSGDFEPLLMPQLAPVVDQDYIPGQVEAGHLDLDTDTQPIPTPYPEGKSPIEKLNIFVANEPSSEPQQEQVITDAPKQTEATTEGVQIQQASAGAAAQHENNAVYLLLAILGLLVIGLLLYVGIKRCRKSQRAYDAEARQTELQDMDKSALGKPLQRNGTEHAPLIGDKTKIDLAKPVNGASKNVYDKLDAKDGAEQPMLTENNGKQANGLQENGVPATETQAHEYHPITPRYPTPKSPRASKYAQYPASGEDNNNTIHNDAYLPSSPKSGRYSPVYSPETGRVKIKLSETPKPKTPMLVTRSRSNAGDIITTPVHPKANTNGHGVH